MTGDYRAATDAFARLGNPGETTKLLAYTARLAQAHPQSSVAQVLKGDALSRSGKFNEALVCLTDAVRLGPESPLPYDVRGIVRIFADKPDLAIQDFSKAIELDEKFAEAHCSRGIVWFSLGDVDRALNDFDKAIELAPDFALAYNARGQLALAIQEWDAAIADFETATKLAPAIGWIQSNTKLAMWARAQAGLSREVKVMGGRGSTLVAQTLVIDGAGVGSRGVTPRQGWAREFLGDKYVQINVRHEGSAPRELPVFGRGWPQEQNVITLAPEFDAAVLDKQIRPMLQKAWADGKSVFLNIDANLTLPGYLARTRAGELQWAASVADYALKQTPAAVHKVFSGHSAFTDVPQYMSEKGAIQNWVLQSPRDYGHMETLARACPKAHFDLVTGEGDAPHLGSGLHDLKAPNVRILDLQKPGLAFPIPDFWVVHSKVGQPSTVGEFKITTLEGTITKQGRLGSLVAEPLKQGRPDFVSLADGRLPNYWVAPNSPFPVASALVSMVNTGSRIPLPGESSPLNRHVVIAGTGKYADSMVQGFQQAGWKVTSMPVYQDQRDVDAFAKQVGAARVVGVITGEALPVAASPASGLAALGDFADVKRRTMPFINPPDKFGGAGVTPSNFRLPFSALPDGNRGGVYMKTDVVTGQPADTSEMFGTATPAKSDAQTEQAGLVCPFLPFCATASATK